MSDKLGYRQKIIPRYFVCKLLSGAGCRAEVCPKYSEHHKDHVDNFDTCPDREIRR